MKLIASAGKWWCWKGNWTKKRAFYACLETALARGIEEEKEEDKFERNKKHNNGGEVLVSEAVNSRLSVLHCENRRG